MAFNSAKGVILPKPIQNIILRWRLPLRPSKNANLNRDDAIALEAKGFTKAATTPQAAALVGLF